MYFNNGIIINWIRGPEGPYTLPCSYTTLYPIAVLTPIANTTANGPTVKLYNINLTNIHIANSLDWTMNALIIGF